MSDLWSPSFPIWVFVVRGAVVYLAVFLLLRMGGKQQIGQMGTGEFVAILLISNAVQNAMNGGDNSITGGLLLSTVIMALSVGIAYLAFRSKRCERWIDGQPRLLIHRGVIVRENLKREWMNEHELMAHLRREGIQQVAEVQDAVLETNGSVSVIKRSDAPTP